MPRQSAWGETRSLTLGKSVRILNRSNATCHKNRFPPTQSQFEFVLHSSLEPRTPSSGGIVPGSPPVQRPTPALSFLGRPTPALVIPSAARNLLSSIRPWAGPIGITIARQFVEPRTPSSGGSISASPPVQRPTPDLVIPSAARNLLFSLPQRTMPWREGRVHWRERVPEKHPRPVGIL